LRKYKESEVRRQKSEWNKEIIQKTGDRKEIRQKIREDA